MRGDVAVDAAVAATMFAPRRFARAASLPGCYGTRQTTRPTEVCAAAATAFRQLRLLWFSKIENTVHNIREVNRNTSD